MTARYGDRSRVTTPVGSWGRAGGVGLAEITFTASPAPAASSTPVTIAGVEYIVIDVTGNTDLTFGGTPATAIADLFIVAGGGGGGAFHAGGGGGGGVITQTVPLSTGPYPIVVGGGGAGGSFPGPSPRNGGNGSNSTGFSFTALGGGGGGQGGQAGLPGGSGGGAGQSNVSKAGGSGTFKQGNNGSRNIPAGPIPNIGCGGGGAGAGFEGTLPAHSLRQGYSGLAARFLQESGTAPPDWDYYGGGGGGASPSSGAAGTGGRGGGGDGFIGPSTSATSGTTNTGGGGGGAGASGTAGSGGSGRVLIRYQRFQA